MLKILNGPLVFLCGFEGIECSEVAAAVRLGVGLPGVDAVLSRFQFAYHNE